MFGTVQALTFVLLLLLPALGAGTCPSRCVCAHLPGSGQLVRCSGLRAHTFPALPDDTIALDLGGNRLTALPPGSLDHLLRLRVLRLDGNPWECGCAILYLKHWLEDNGPSVQVTGSRCTLPDRSERDIAALTGNEFPPCSRSWELNCRTFFQRDVSMLFLALVSVLLTAFAALVARGICKKP